jgi:putative FmdB family regulatory protein
MPTYEYKCRDCDFFFTDLLKISERLEPTNKDCPNCSKGETVYLTVGATPSMDIMSTTLGTAKHKPTPEFREVVNRIKKKYPGARKTLKDY